MKIVKLEEIKLNMENLLMAKRQQTQAKRECFLSASDLGSIEMSDTTLSQINESVMR